MLHISDTFFLLKSQHRTPIQFRTNNTPTMPPRLPPHAFQRRSRDITTANITNTTPTATEIADLVAAISRLFMDLRRDYFAAAATITTTTTTVWQYYDVSSRPNRVFMHVFLEGVRGEQLRASWLPVESGDEAAARARRRALFFRDRIVALQEGIEELDNMIARRDREDQQEREREQVRERRRAEGGDEDREFFNGVNQRRLDAQWGAAFGRGDPNLSLAFDEDDEDDDDYEDDDEDEEGVSFESLIEKGVVKHVDREEVEAKESVCCPICHAPWEEMTSERVREKEGEDWAKWFCREPCGLRCGHFFGRVCLEAWLETSNSCPMCRRIVRH
ncbi:hypothetical protein SLS54_003278 [Diplodia seriata]